MIWWLSSSPPAASDAHLARMFARRRQEDENRRENERREEEGLPRLNPCDHDTGEAFLPTDAELDDHLYREILSLIGAWDEGSGTKKAAMRETLRRFRAGEHMNLPESIAWAEENPKRC